MTKSFDEWWEENCMNVSADRTEAFDIYCLGQQSKQAEIDELRKRIETYENHVKVIKHIHENKFDENSDTSWILGNLDGFFECLESDLKGDQS